MSTLASKSLRGGRRQRGQLGRRSRRNQRGGGQLTATDLDSGKTFIRTKYGINVYNITYVKEPESLIFDFSALSTTTLYNLGKMDEFLKETELRLGDMLFGDCPNITYFKGKLTAQNIGGLVITVTANPAGSSASLILLSGSMSETLESIKTIAQIKEWLTLPANNIVVNSGAIAAKEKAAAAASKASAVASSAASSAASGIKSGFSSMASMFNKKPAAAGGKSRRRRNSRKMHRSRRSRA